MEDIKVPAAARVRRNSQHHNVEAGSTFTDILYNGRQVTFKALVVPHAQIEKVTMVSAYNDRDQGSLTAEALGELAESMRINKQVVWAYGRELPEGVIEVAAGSRRRAGAILSGCDYKILVADLTDEEVEMLSIMENIYKAPGDLERGRRYRRLVRKLGSQRKVESHLAETGEKVSRRVIGRCIKAAELPACVVGCFHNVSDITGDIAETLHKYCFILLEPDEGVRIDDESNISVHMLSACRTVTADHNMKPKELADYLTEFCRERIGIKGTGAGKKKPDPIKRSYGGGLVHVKQQGDSLLVDIHSANEAQRKEIEDFIKLTLEVEQD